MKYKFIKNNESIFPIEKICNILKLSPSGYYKWKNRYSSKRLLLKEKIKTANHFNIFFIKTALWKP